MPAAAIIPTAIAYIAVGLSQAIVRVLPFIMKAVCTKATVIVKLHS